MCVLSIFSMFLPTLVVYPAQKNLSHRKEAISVVGVCVGGGGGGGGAGRKKNNSLAHDKQNHIS